MPLNSEIDLSSLGIDFAMVIMLHFLSLIHN